MLLLVVGVRAIMQTGYTIHELQFQPALISGGSLDRQTA